MKIDRLIGILAVLLQQDKVTAPELAERFEVSRRTINRDIDDFDLICHIAYDQAPLTKAERANNVRKRGYLYKYSGLAQEVLSALLDKYMNEGIRDIESLEMV